jgi:hypothetical protein
MESNVEIDRGSLAGAIHGPSAGRIVTHLVHSVPQEPHPSLGSFISPKRDHVFVIEGINGLYPSLNGYQSPGVVNIRDLHREPRREVLLDL